MAGFFLPLMIPFLLPQNRQIRLPQEIEFTQGAVAEDYSLFMQGQRNKLVPTKALLQRHLALRTRGENPKSLEQAPKLMGLKNPVIVTYPLSYVAIAHMNVKMIMILCEPRLVHIFFVKKASFASAPLPFSPLQSLRHATLLLVIL